MNQVKLFLAVFSDKFFVRRTIQLAIIPFNHSVILNNFSAIRMILEHRFQSVFGALKRSLTSDSKIFIFKFLGNDFRLLPTKLGQWRVVKTGEPPSAVVGRFTVSKNVDFHNYKD